MSKSTSRARDEGQKYSPDCRVMSSRGALAIERERALASTLA